MKRKNTPPAEVRRQARALARATQPDVPNRLLSLDELNSAKGIRYSRFHIDRLIKARKFPKPIKIGGRCNAWLEAEIDAWIEQRAAERDAA